MNYIQFFDVFESQLRERESQCGFYIKNALNVEDLKYCVMIGLASFVILTEKETSMQRMLDFVKEIWLIQKQNA